MKRATLTAGEVRFRASPKDIERIKALVKFYEVTTSGLLRMLIGEAFRRVTGRKARST